MKTPEDEAFEDIERRQGGFQAKRQMAADKLQDSKCKLCVDGCAACDARAQPAQEPLHIVQSNGKHSPLLTHMMNKRANPPKREWVELTDDEEIADFLGEEFHTMTESEERFFRLGMQASKEKNA